MYNNSPAAVNADGHQTGDLQNVKGSTTLTASAASQTNGHAASCAPRNGKTTGAGAACGSTLANAQNGHHHVQGSSAKGDALAEAADEQGPAQLQLFDLVYSLVRVPSLARLIHQHLCCCALAMFGASCKALCMDAAFCMHRHSRIILMQLVWVLGR